jgi:uncharacterized caspase-like protein
MCKARSFLIFAGLISVLLTAAASVGAEPAERRVALVIGESRYANVPRLANTENDAKLVARTLQGLGFTLVGGGALMNLDKPAFDKAIRDFAGALGGSTAALFFYAGHGLQMQGTNYLVPVDANPTKPADAYFELVDVGTVLHQMEGAGTRLNLVLLDACRNNPFSAQGLRATGGGLAQMEAPKGTLISYATQPGNVASDGAAGGNSPYALALTRAMQEPGHDVFELFNTVGVDVDRRTDGAQQPWLSSSPIEGNFYFSARPEGGPAPAASDTDPHRIELAYWDAVRDSNSAAMLKAYLEKYPQGEFADQARARLAALPPVALAAPPPAAARAAPQSFDGTWSGTESCSAWSGGPAGNFPLAFTVTGGRIAAHQLDEATVVVNGTPRQGQIETTLGGEVRADGAVTVIGSGRALGTLWAIQYAGSVTGGGMHLAGTLNRRTCQADLVRR